MKKYLIIIALVLIVISSYASDLNDLLFGAISKNNLPRIKELIKKGVDINIINKYGETPLILASIYGHYEIVNFLIEKGANIDAVDKHGSSSLIMACYELGSLKTLKILIEYKANINLQNHDGDTALITASYYGNYEIVKYLIENGADVNIKNNKGSTALDYVMQSYKEGTGDITTKDMYEKLIKLLKKKNTILLSIDGLQLMLD